jgi:hypothetical protein
MTISRMPTGAHGRWGLALVLSSATRVRWSLGVRCSNSGWPSWPQRSPWKPVPPAPIDGAATGYDLRSLSSGKKEQTAFTTGSVTSLSPDAGRSSGCHPDTLVVPLVRVTPLGAHFAFLPAVQPRLKSRLGHRKMRLFQANLLVEDVEWGSDSRRNRPPWAEPHPFKRVQRGLSVIQSLKQSGWVECHAHADDTMSSSPYCGFQPSSVRAWTPLENKATGSPGLRGASS